MAMELQKLVEQSPQISSLPTIFYQINEAVEDPECSFVEIGEIISGDPSLSARLLRIVNSSYFGFPNKVETITHAVTIVGMAQLRDLALATTVVNQFKGISKKLINMEKFWLHSVATGLTARVIAIYRRESNADRFYLMGMLHDLGRLLLLLNLPGSIQTIMEEYEQGGTMYEVESNVLGFDHAAAAGQLMKAWQLPEMLQEAVEYQHKPEQAPHYPLAASIVHVADFIAHGMELGSCGERYVPPLSPKAWELLEFQPNLLPSLMEQVDRQVKEAVEIFL
ncbi:MAG: HDOD domain-containing protein [Nitrospinae bacterium]|nr:HDOD domain-containing protein [Nitrospinota bacterium]